MVDKEKRPQDAELDRAREEAAVRYELNVLALIKGNERYVFVYDDDSRAALIDTFRDQAADPALSFTWFDATVMTEKAREQGRNSSAVPPASKHARFEVGLSDDTP